MSTAIEQGLLRTYRPFGGGYDELVLPDGSVRGHWAPVANALGELGLQRLLERRREADRLLEADGVSYHSYGTERDAGAGRAGQAWKLDPLPLLLASDQWAAIEQGIIERAELLNLVLADLYGPRDLLRRGLLPPEVVFGHAGFLRACDGIRLPGSQQLFLYAADLARDAEGRTWVLGDRTQAPSGAGYALENRMVVSRVFPSLYRDAQVHRLAPFFRALRAALQAVAPPRADDPRVVVLTPGPWNETYFEHAQLASYLGYPLVEGEDLAVRDGRVWMRSLGRLEPVDVILRRVDGWFADPLELNPESQLGVPGLVEACRLGGVSVVNTLGSSVLENPGLLPFLPRVAEHLLGRDLRLPSVPTWWCGDDLARRHVVTKLPTLVVKHIGRGPGRPSVIGSQLSQHELAEVRARIEAHPHAWVGQDLVSLASAPALTDHGLEPRRSVLRAFAVARHDSYTAMPGGLTRVAAAADELLISNQGGAFAKDTWVLASEPEALTGFWLQRGPAVRAVDPAGSMSSRAAENLYWLGRYAERAEGAVRLLRATFDRRNEFQGGANPAGEACVKSLLAAVTQVTGTHPGFVGAGSAQRLRTPGAELLSLVVDADRPGTLAFALRRMLDAADAVRDQLSADTWQVAGNLDREIVELRRPAVDGNAPFQGVLGRVLQGLLALAGLGAESMTRDPGWRFMDAGRRLERATHLASLLKATVCVERDTATDSLLLESVLVAAESILTYRRRYRSQAQLETLLDLLLLDTDNPRSLVYQVERLVAEVEALPRDPNMRRTPEQRCALELAAHVHLADTALLARTDANGARPDLEAFLARTVELLGQLSDALDAAHFTHRPPQRSLAAVGARARSRRTVGEG